MYGTSLFNSFYTVAEQHVKIDMHESTPFGYLEVPQGLDPARKAAVLRALDWCYSLVQGTDYWRRGRKKQGKWGLTASRKFNGRTITVYPLLAASMDVGSEKFTDVGFGEDHLPVSVNGYPVCVVPDKDASASLITDWVASLIQLFRSEHPPRPVIPVTLARELNMFTTVEKDYGNFVFSNLHSNEDQAAILGKAEALVAWLESSRLFTLGETIGGQHYIRSTNLAVDVAFDLDWTICEDCQHHAEHESVSLIFGECFGEDGPRYFTTRFPKKAAWTPGGSIDFLHTTLQTLEKHLHHSDRRGIPIPLRRLLYPDDFPTVLPTVELANHAEFGRNQTLFRSLLESSASLEDVIQWIAAFEEDVWDELCTHFEWSNHMARAVDLSRFFLKKENQSRFMPRTMLWAMSMLKQDDPKAYAKWLYWDALYHAQPEVRSRAALDYRLERTKFALIDLKPFVFAPDQVTGQRIHERLSAFLVHDEDAFNEYLDHVMWHLDEELARARATGAGVRDLNPEGGMLSTTIPLLSLRYRNVLLALLAKHRDVDFLVEGWIPRVEPSHLPTMLADVHIRSARVNNIVRIALKRSGCSAETNVLASTSSAP